MSIAAARGMYPEQVQQWRQACILASNPLVPTAGREGTVQGGQEAHPATEQELRQGPGRGGSSADIAKSSMPTGATSTRPGLTSLPERQQYVAWWREALEAGARKHPAAEVLGLSLRTLQRWLAEPELSADGRPDAVRPTPAHALSPEERQAVLDVCNSQSSPRCRRVKSYHGWPTKGVTWPASRASIASCGRLTSSTGVAGASHRVMCRHQPVMPRPGPIKRGPGISPTCRHRAASITTSI